MPISPDQQATLQLLLERGQSYGDLAKLLGQSESEVRARARAALAEIGGADPDRNVGLTDYLLGQADPIGRADASRHLRDDPEDHRLATDLSESLREMFPAAELPRLPGEPRRPRRRPERSEPRQTPLSGLSSSQTRTIAIAAVAGVLVLLVVLGIAGVFGGGDDDAQATGDEATTTTAASADDQQVQTVPLVAVGGGDAQGEATFGLATGDQPYVDISIDGLDPAPSGQTYVIWLMLTATQGYPLSPIAVDEDGSFQNRYSIPSTVLGLISRVRAVDVSIAPVKAIRKLVRDAIENNSLVLKEPGEVILRGEVPTGGGQGTDEQGTGGDSGSGSGN